MESLRGRKYIVKEKKQDKDHKSECNEEEVAESKGNRVYIDISTHNVII